MCANGNKYRKCWQKYKNRHSFFQTVKKTNIRKINTIKKDRKLCPSCVKNKKKKIKYTFSPKHRVADIIRNNPNIYDDKIITFGKYKDSTFLDIYLNDERYCNWAISLNENDVSINLYYFRTYIIAKNNQ